ncbi:hypothetical protein JCM3770_002626 [Rhodotorula araucariae]
MPRVSKSAEADEPLSSQSLKAAVWYTVTKIAQEEELSLPFAASEHFVATLAEVVFQQALSLGKDLERFAKHAGRLTINADDVKLAARRNEPLYELLATSAQQHGLTLADLKADATSAAKGAKKQVKAPRLAAGAAKEKEREKKDKKSRSTGAESKGKAKGKGKARASDNEEDAGDEVIDESEPELVGGFVKASALKKARGKGKGRVVDDSDGAEDDDARGGDTGDESEEVGSKRRKGSKGGSQGAKRRKSTG